MKKQQERERIKSDRIREIQTAAAEAVIRQAVADGVKVRAVYAENRIELEFTQSNGKKIIMYVRYEDFSTGGCGLVSLVRRLDAIG